MTECLSCGKTTDLLNDFCPHCGVIQDQKIDRLKKEPIDQLNKTTAAILALLLGGIGIHRFYLKRFFTGVLYLIFSFTLIPAFLGLLECIRLLMMDEKYFNDHYCTKKVQSFYHDRMLSSN